MYRLCKAIAGLRLEVTLIRMRDERGPQTPMLPTE
jgi:hypothetical protein